MDGLVECGMSPDGVPTEAQRVRCPSCGAPSPILTGDVTTCPYCLERFSLPAGVAEPLVAHEALGRAIESTRLRAEAARKGAKAPPWATIAVGSALALMGVLGTATPIAFARARTSTEDGSILSTALMAIAYGGMMAGVFVGVMRAMRNARLRLAMTPFAEVHATDRLSLSCPSCGAEMIEEGSAIVQTCGHCQSAALVPAVFLPLQHQKKHAALLRLRRREGDSRAVARSTQNIITESVGWAMLTIGVLGASVFVVATMTSDFAPHLTGAERLMLPICSGGIVFGIFGGFGLMNIRAARRSLRPGGTDPS